MATQNLRSFRKHQSLVLFHPERDEIEAIFLPKLVLTCGEVNFNSIFKVIFREEYTYPHELTPNSDLSFQTTICDIQLP